MSDLDSLTRWIGAGVAVLGAFVVSPDGSRLIGKTIADRCSYAFGQAKGRLARLLPFLRRDVSVHAAVALSDAAGVADAIVVDRTMDWDPEETIAEKVERLHTQIGGLVQWYSDLRITVDEGFAAETARYVALGDRVDKSAREFRDLHLRAERRAVTTDARALPIVGAGVLLSGAPEAFVWLPWPVWGFLMLGVIALAGSLTRAAWRDRRELVHLGT
jgi:hypothetical protein